MRVAVILLGLGACSSSSGGGGGGGDVSAFIGTYTTTSHTYVAGQGTSIACGAAGTAVTPPTPSFTLAADPFFDDGSMLVLASCADAAGASCTDTLVELSAGPGGSLAQTSANSQTGGGGGCQLYYSHATATLTGDTLAIEADDKYDAPDISDADCTLARAEALASSPDCQSVERWTGTRQ